MHERKIFFLFYRRYERSSDLVNIFGCCTERENSDIPRILYKETKYVLALHKCKLKRMFKEKINYPVTARKLFGKIGTRSAHVGRRKKRSANYGSFLGLATPL